MNLPQHIQDQSILRYEPLCTYIALYEQCATRSQSNVVVSDFVEAMRKDDQAALACKEWAHLAFEKTHSRDKFWDVERLYEPFFYYYFKLSRGKPKEAEKYRCHVVRNGIGLVGPANDGRRPTHRRGSKAKSEAQRPPRLQRVSDEDSFRAGTGDHSHEGNAEMVSSVGFHSVTNSSVIPPLGVPPGINTQLSDSAPVKKGKHSTSKKEKKRKASSQKPHVITPSDDSGDERKLSKTKEAAIAHRQKRIAPNPPCPSRKLCGTKITSARRPQIAREEDTNNVSQASSSLTTSRPGKLIPGLQVARRSAGPPLSCRKRNNIQVSSVFKRPTRAKSKLGGLRKVKSGAHLPARPRKRPRCSSMPAIVGEREGVSKSTYARFNSESVIEHHLDAPSLSSLGNVRVKAKRRKKRTRTEYETGSIVPPENTEVDFSELLGPDIRPSRPLPRKIRSERSVPHADDDTPTLGIQCGLPSLQQADQLLRDAAGNALVILSEGVAPDMPDWTQDKEQDAEYDDFDNQDETNDLQSATACVAPVGAPKPPVPAAPRIWAQSRQEVCESFEHFRSYHSGVYSKDDIVKGYLLGAYAASRDKFHHSGKLIISHGGGKSESILDCRKGRKRYQMDQDQEASDQSVRALLKTWKDRRPLVLLADDKYALFPYDLASGSYTYVVLGLYWISHAWAESQPSRDGSSRIVRWKFAFQWCEGQGDPWWVPQQSTDITPQASVSLSGSSICPTNGPSHLPDASGNPNTECESCQEQSPFTYEQGWMCLNPHCEKFWSIDGKEPDQLDYREEFLRLLPQRFERLPDILPTKVVETPGGITTSFACSKGWHCAHCGRLSCRFKWEHWECSNCGFKREVKGRVRLSKEFWNQRPPKEFMHARIGKDSGIIARRFEPIDLGEHKGFTNRLTFILPHDRGKIHIILGTPLSNCEANSIFELYQQQASNGELKLRRYPLRNHRARGQLLTNYFSQNSGEPYQYVGGTGNTVPFDQAPDCVRRALAVIKEKARLALHADVPFNEILSAAYMERQKMSFHSDSEKGLGPVVASLSLGSAALMHFRPLVNAGELKGKNAYALSLVLRHGDVLIMDGEGVQKYYEHTVVPMNFRIAATARCIGST